jgi:hypothetical protein
MEIKMIEHQNTKRVRVPYDTGKVKIGLTHVAPPPRMDEFDEQIQEILLGIRPWKHTIIRNVLLYCTAILGMLAFVLFWTLARGAITNA